MNKEKIRTFHKNKPAAEIIIISLLQAPFGLFVGLYAGRVSSGTFNTWWQYINIPSFWLLFIFQALAILYYIFFSTYSVNKLDELDDYGAEDVLERLGQVTVTVLSPDKPYKDNIECVNLYTETFIRLHRSIKKR